MKKFKILYELSDRFVVGAALLGGFDNAEDLKANMLKHITDNMDDNMKLMIDSVKVFDDYEAVTPKKEEKSEVKEPEWIPAKDEVPVNDNLVLVLGNDGRYILARYGCLLPFFNGIVPKSWYSDENGLTTYPDDYITHWIPLPEGPKEQ